jgi:aspartate/methionine/tyrosine aminotransferase
MAALETRPREKDYGMNEIISAASTRLPEPERLRRLKIPGRAGLNGQSVREADIALLANAPSNYLDTTHFDTVRFPPPLWAKDIFDTAASDGDMAYSLYRGHPAVLDAVAENVSAFLGHPVEARRNLMLTAGTQAGLFCALSAMIEIGSRVVLLDPDYLFSERILGFLGTDVGHVRLLLDGGDPQPDFVGLEDEFKSKGARFMVFSHPNNPTGAVYSQSVIARIAELAQRYDVTVLVDELYSRLLHDGRTFCHLAAEPGMFDRTVTLLGPSKTESLSGYRLGVVVAPPDLIDRMENVQAVTTLRAPAYAQSLLVPWLRDDRQWLAERLEAFSALRQTTNAAFARLPWAKVIPQAGTAYVWVDVAALNLPGTAVAQAILTRAGVLVSPGYQFGPSSADHFRICYARDEAEWDKALDRILAVLNDLAVGQGLPAMTR